MAVTGPPPKEGRKRHRGAPAHEWIDVVDVPFTGKPLVALPPRRRLELDGRMVSRSWEPMTRAWWRTIRSMPHCVLWTKTDWQFAVTTAVVADNAFRGSKAALTELRHRERIMGVTVESRPGLRIRYVPKNDGPKLAIVPKSAVVSIDVRRQRSTTSDPV